MRCPRFLCAVIWGASAATRNLGVLQPRGVNRSTRRRGGCERAGKRRVQLVQGFKGGMGMRCPRSNWLVKRAAGGRARSWAAAAGRLVPTSEAESENGLQAGVDSALSTAFLEEGYE